MKQNFRFRIGMNGHLHEIFRSLRLSLASFSVSLTPFLYFSVSPFVHYYLSLVSVSFIIIVTIQNISRSLSLRSVNEPIDGMFTCIWMIRVCCGTDTTPSMIRGHESRYFLHFRFQSSVYWQTPVYWVQIIPVLTHCGSIKEGMLSFSLIFLQCFGTLLRRNNLDRRHQNVQNTGLCFFHLSFNQAEESSCWRWLPGSSLYDGCLLGLKVMKIEGKIY